MQTRIILIGLIALTAFLGITTIALWSISRSAATVNSQNDALKQLIKVNESEISVGEIQIAAERDQVAVEEQQLRATIEEINANNSKKVVIPASPTVQPTPTSNTPSTSGEPIIIAGSDSTWQSSYGIFLSGFAAVIAAGTGTVVVIRSRTRKNTEKAAPGTPSSKGSEAVE
jgi:CRISPR/Cas system CMR subunit Cmr4 (Cas7 group RAMP superfamily)